MSNKVKPSEQLSKELRQLMDGQSGQDEDLLSQLMQLGARKVIQEGLEAEVDEFLDRDWYERSEQTPKGYRNGYSPKRLKTRLGHLQVDRPRIRDNEEPFESQLLDRLEAIEGKLDKLVTEMYARGLSTQDIEQTLTDEDGTPVVSGSAASRMSDALYEEYEQWRERDLSTFDVVYLFADGVYEAVRSYTHGQTILCAWGICADGTKVLLGLEAVATESKDCWRTFFEDLQSRGLRQPLFAVSDGGGGVKSALTKCFPYATRGRCIAHKMRNLMNKLPRDEQIQDTMKRQLKAVYYAPDRETADQLAAGIIDAYAGDYPNMVKCFQSDLDACLAHLKFPAGHRRYIRTTNLIERAFVEQKRRTKIIPAHINEKGAIKLVYGSLIRAARNWRRVGMEERELAELRNLRKTMTHEDDIIIENNQISYKLAA